MFRKLLRQLHIFLYRLTGGRVGGGMGGFNVLLLNSLGRKSGETRTNAVGYFVDGANFIVIASNFGAGPHPAWYHNLKANPNTTIQVKSQLIKVKAETANPTERQRLWAELMKIAPSYADLEKKVNRELPVVILHPLG